MILEDAIIAKAAALFGLAPEALFTRRSRREEVAAWTVAALALEHAAYTRRQIAAALLRERQNVTSRCKRATDEHRRLARAVWFEALAEHDGPVSPPERAA